MQRQFSKDISHQGVSAVLRLGVAVNAVTLCLFPGDARAKKTPVIARNEAGTRLILMCDNGKNPVNDTELALIVRVLRARLARLGPQSAGVEMDTANRGRFVVTLPAESDVDRIKNLLTYVGKLELRPVVHGTDRRYPDKKSADADARDRARGIYYEVVELHETFRGGGADSKQTDPGGWIVLEKGALVGNGDIVKATAATRYGEHIVDFTLTQDAAERFGQWTGSHIGDSLAIVLDGVVKSAPTIQSRISDRGVIVGSFDEIGAEDLAFALESGALPVRLRILSEGRLQEKE